MVHFSTKEQSVDMLSELVDLFSPQGGTACDQYGGTLTKAIACVRKVCKCYESSKNKEYFDGGIGRLGRFLPSYNPSDSIYIAFAVEAMKQDFYKDIKVAANVLLDLRKMSGDVSDTVKGHSTEIHKSEVSGDNQRSDKTNGQTEMDEEVGKSDSPSIS